MDLQKFLTAQFVQREKKRSVPALADFFAEGEPAEWIVRGLSSSELALARDAEASGVNLRAMITALSGTESDKAEAMRKLAGVSTEDVPGDVAKRIEMLIMGSVSPALSTSTRDVAVHLATYFPETFFQLTNDIQALTVQGAVMGKPKASTGKAK